MQTPSQRVIPFGEENINIQTDPVFYNNNQLFKNKMSFHSSEFNRDFNNNFNVDIDLDKMDEIQNNKLNQELNINRTKSYQKQENYFQFDSQNVNN